MKTRTILTVFAALLVSAAGLRADDDSDRYGRRYEPRYGINAYQLDKVQRLAHEVEDRARYVHRSAERYAHHGTHREERALLAFRELESRARHFHRQVERYRQDFRHTRGDFLELQRAFANASHATHGAHAFGKINREFRRLTDAMIDLEIYADELFGPSRDAHYRNRTRSRLNGWYDNRYERPRLRFRWQWGH